MAILIGLGIGFAIAVTGVGGGTLTVPILVLALGIPAVQSVGTALIFAAVIKMSAAIAYIHRKAVDLKTLAYLLLGGIPGVMLGGLCLQRFRANNRILAVIGLAVVVSAGFSLLRLGNSPRSRFHWRALPPFSFLIGIEMGFSSAGAGALGTVLLFHLTPLPAATVVGTDLLFGLAVSAVGGGLHMAAGNWNRTILVQLLIGGLVGAFLGSHFANVFPARLFRRIILVWAIFLGLFLLSKGLFHVV